jgi:hypothetical protein
MGDYMGLMDGWMDGGLYEIDGWMRDCTVLKRDWVLMPLKVAR